MEILFSNLCKGVIELAGTIEEGPNLIRNRKRRQSQKAADKLKAILTRHGYLCHWRKVPLILLRDLPPAAIISRTSDEVVWRSQEGVRKRWFATVDHILPICEGGTNAPYNLVPSCARCNRKRTKTKSPKSSAERKICPKCGGAKPIHRKKCAECRKGTGVERG